MNDEFQTPKRTAPPASKAKLEAKVDIANSKIKTADERSWAIFDATIRNMIPTPAALELINHSRAYYFSAHAQKWRDFLRNNERSRRQGFGGKVRNIHGM